MQAKPSVLLLDLAAALRRGKRSTERVVARAQFFLQGRHRPQLQLPLSRAQVQQYRNEGYLLVSGLIPPEVSARAEQAMRRCMEAARDAPEIRVTQDRAPLMLEDPFLLACYTRECIAAAAQLADDDVATFLRPKSVMSINVFPTRSDWRWHQPHIDHANLAARHRTFPRAFRIATMVYLSNVESQGGGTMVWPGSHGKIEALARSDRKKYALMSALNADVGKVELGSPLELTPWRGDVLFYHCLCVHAASANISASPRLAISKKW